MKEPNVYVQRGICIPHVGPRPSHTVEPSHSPLSTQQRCQYMSMYTVGDLRMGRKPSHFLSVVQSFAARERRPRGRAQAPSRGLLHCTRSTLTSTTVARYVYAHSVYIEPCTHPRPNLTRPASGSTSWRFAPFWTVMSPRHFVLPRSQIARKRILRVHPYHPSHTPMQRLSLTQARPSTASHAAAGGS